MRDESKPIGWPSWTEEVANALRSLPESRTADFDPEPLYSGILASATLTRNLLARLCEQQGHDRRLSRMAEQANELLNQLADYKLRA